VTQTPKELRPRLGTLRLWILLPAAVHLVGAGYVAAVDAPLLGKAAREQRDLTIHTKTHEIYVPRATVLRDHRALPTVYWRGGLLGGLLLAWAVVAGRWRRVAFFGAVGTIVAVNAAFAAFAPEAYGVLWRHAAGVLGLTTAASLVLVGWAVLWDRSWR
jgi:hypothetical protein